MWARVRSMQMARGTSRPASAASAAMPKKNRPEPPDALPPVEAAASGGIGVPTGAGANPAAGARSPWRGCASALIPAPRRAGGATLDSVARPGARLPCSGGPPNPVGVVCGIARSGGGVEETAVGEVAVGGMVPLAATLVPDAVEGCADVGGGGVVPPSATAQAALPI
jgi:hypothetical protein